MKQSIALTILLTIFSTIAFAEDLPKSGKYSGRYYWTYDGKVFPVGQDRMILSGNLPGVIFNDAGKGFLHNARLDCQIFWDINKGKSNANGSCITTDAEGDKALSLWTCVGTLPTCDGELKFDGGTGKYTGITGNSKFKATVIGQTQAGFSLISGEWKYRKRAERPHSAGGRMEGVLMFDYRNRATEGIGALA